VSAATATKTSTATTRGTAGSTTTRYRRLGRALWLPRAGCTTERGVSDAAQTQVKLFQAFVLQREGHGEMAGATWAEEFDAEKPDAAVDVSAHQCPIVLSRMRAVLSSTTCSVGTCISKQCCWHSDLGVR
jgi:hypothetical protein